MNNTDKKQIERILRFLYDTPFALGHRACKDESLVGIEQDCFYLALKLLRHIRDYHCCNKGIYKYDKIKLTGKTTGHKGKL